MGISDLRGEVDVAKTLLEISFFFLVFLCFLVSRVLQDEAAQPLTASLCISVAVATALFHTWRAQNGGRCPAQECCDEAVGRSLPVVECGPACNQ